MARLNAEGNLKIRFADTIADPTAPTATEWAGATNLSPFMDGDSITFPDGLNWVDDFTVEDTHDKQAPGTTSGNFEFELFRDTDAEIDPFNLFDRDDKGYLLVATRGEPEAGDMIGCVEVIAHQPIMMSPTRNSRQRCRVAFGSQMPLNEVELVAGD